MQVTGSRWLGLTRAAAAFGVLLGVFVMHGLTGDHDVTMIPPDAGAAPSVAPGTTDSHSVAARSHSAAPEVVALGSMASAVPLRAQTAFVPVDGHHHAMSDVCLGMLTSLLLLLALTLALRSLMVWRTVPLVARIEQPGAAGRSPPWLAPSLSKLCVLRT